MFFNDGEQVIQYISEKIDGDDVNLLPDIILLDMNMHVMNGIFWMHTSH